MKIIVTGGAGFIGSHVVRRLAEGGHEVTIVDNFDPFYPRRFKEENLASLPSPLCIVEADICDMKALRQVPGDCEVILHLAAQAGARHSIRDPLKFQMVNVIGTMNVLEMARERSVSHFVFASSSSVYGTNPHVPWQEEDLLFPVNPYAASKISGELLGRVYSHLHGIRFVALRLFTVYGPRQRPDLAIRKFVELMLRGEKIPVFGNGSTSRDYTYVDDVVDGIVAAVHYRQSAYEVINLGSSRPISMRELVRTLEEILCRTAILDVHPTVEGEASCTHADISKARRLLDYSPTTRFADGVANLVAWLGERK